VAELTSSGADSIASCSASASGAALVVDDAPEGLPFALECSPEAP
jgi:hypothetical protein